MTTQRHTTISRPLYILLCLLAIVVSMCVTQRAHAQTSLPCTALPASQSFNLGTVFLPANTTTGMLLGSPQSVTITFNCAVTDSSAGGTAGTCVTDNAINLPKYNAPFLNIIVPSGLCRTATGTVLWALPTKTGCAECNLTHLNDIELQSLIQGAPTSVSGGLLYPTSISGISLLLTQVGGTLSNGGTLVQATFSNPNVTATFTAQLEVTGTVTPGTGTSINLLTFEDFTSGTTNSSTSYGSLTSGTFTVASPACTVSAGSVNMTVKLPDIFANALTATGATAGKTGFNINLNCQFGTTSPTLAVTMTTANAQSGVNGVVAPSTGGASNVGVQLLNSTSTPIVFNQAQVQTSVANGAVAIPYFAQYYATGTPIGAGNVTATVTFNLTYP
jgi:type 1 fimbria pilin